MFPTIIPFLLFSANTMPCPGLGGGPVMGLLLWSRNPQRHSPNLWSLVLANARRQVYPGVLIFILPRVSLAQCLSCVKQVGSRPFLFQAANVSRAPKSKIPETARCFLTSEISKCKQMAREGCKVLLVERQATRSQKCLTTNHRASSRRWSRQGCAL